MAVLRISKKLTINNLNQDIDKKARFTLNGWNRSRTFYEKKKQKQKPE